MPDSQDRITRDDIEARLRDLKDTVDGKTVEAKAKAVPAAVTVGILLVIIIFLMGRRAGAKRSTIVEIRRI
jgi:hypothetical protein